MWKKYFILISKDFKLMLSSKFFLLALGSLILYSCYINFVYVKINQEIFTVFYYDPNNSQLLSSTAIKVDSKEELYTACDDGDSVGIDFSNTIPEIYMLSSGSASLDNCRSSYAISIFSAQKNSSSMLIGKNNKEMKNRREITAEFLFFELSAVGFLGLAAMLFKEKQMGVIRVHSILPISKNAFILSKLGLILLSDLIFTVLLTIVNLGVTAASEILPMVLLQAAILSSIMALIGFLCAMALSDFKQFSLFYLILAIFITTPVFLAGQTGISWTWINYHPMYYLFVAMKNAYFQTLVTNVAYYLVSLITIILLFLIAHRWLSHEMSKEG